MPRQPKWMRRRDRCPNGSTTPNPSLEPSTREEMHTDKPSANVDHNATTRDLWNEAYKNLRESNFTLVDHYEKILLSEVPEEHGPRSKEEQLSRVAEGSGSNGG